MVKLSSIQKVALANIASAGRMLPKFMSPSRHAIKTSLGATASKPAGLAGMVRKSMGNDIARGAFKLKGGKTMATPQAKFQTNKALRV